MNTFSPIFLPELTVIKGMDLELPSINPWHYEDTSDSINHDSIESL